MQLEQRLDARCSHVRSSAFDRPGADVLSQLQHEQGPVEARAHQLQVGIAEPEPVVSISGSHLVESTVQHTGNRTAHANRKVSSVLGNPAKAPT